MNRATNALVCAATADVARPRHIDLGVAGIGAALQELCSAHELACLAIAALRNVFSEPGSAQAPGGSSRQPLDRRYVTLANGAHKQLAGARGLTVKVHRAGAAGSDAAAEFGAHEAKRVSQHPQERCVGIHVESVKLFI